MSDYVPQDLMPAILKRLPVKSLARFRCVRRSWNDLITSASFNAAHLACSSMEPRLLLGYQNEPLLVHARLPKRYFLLDSEMVKVNAKTFLPPFKMPSDPEPLWTHQIIGAVNGVLCLSNCRVQPEIVLWNPSIRKYIPLPRVEFSFELWRCRELLGFGVKESEGDLRVIRVRHVTVYREEVNDEEIVEALSNNRSPYIVDEFDMVEVCSARDRIWRALNADILRDCHIIDGIKSPQCLVHGVVHWIVHIGAVVGDITKALLFFDFEKEVLGFLALPDVLAKTCHFMNVVRFRGMLGVLKYDGPYCGIWVMSEYGNVNSWSLIFNINIGRQTRELGWKVSGLTEGGLILVSDPYDSEHRQIMFDPANRAYRRLHFKEDITFIYASDFVESLIFIDNESGAVTPPEI